MICEAFVISQNKNGTFTIRYKYGYQGIAQDYSAKDNNELEFLFMCLAAPQPTLILVEVENNSITNIVNNEQRYQDHMK